MGDYRYWSKWKHYGFTEQEAKEKFEEGQLDWAQRTKSGYESMQQWHDENGDVWEVSATKRKHYEAACRILMLRALNK